MPEPSRPSIDRLAQRPGLATSDRLLCAGIAAVPPADWDRLRQLAAWSRDADHGPSRAEWEETLLQAVLFCGFPRVVTAFEVLEEAWPRTAGETQNDAVPEAERAHRGTGLFDAIYAANAPAVHDLLRGFHPEFHDFVIEAAYGRVLARPAFGPKRRELLAVAALAALDQTRQLIAHARGALRFEATELELTEALITARPDEEWTAQTMRRVLRGFDSR